MPRILELPFGLPGKVYRSCMPGSRRYDPTRSVLDDAAALEVGAVVVLASAEECAVNSAIPDLRHAYRRLGWIVLDMPVEDFAAPALGPLEATVSHAIDLARGGTHLLVHCHAGIGRTGTFLACMRRRLVPGDDGPGAIAWVRQYVAWAVETEGQEEFVRAFR